MGLLSNCCTAQGCIEWATVTQLTLKLTVALGSAQNQEAALEIELQQLQMFVQCREKAAPGCHICVFSSSDDYPNKLMVHSARQVEMYTEAGFNRHACSCTPWKNSPILQVDNVNRRQSRLFSFSLSLIPLLVGRASWNIHPRLFSPFYFSTNFLSGEQFLEASSLFLYSFHSCALHCVDCFVCPSRLQRSVVVIWVSLRVEFLFGLFFIYFPPPKKQKGAYIYS